MSSAYSSSDIEVSPTGIPRPRSFMFFTMSLIKAENIAGDTLFLCATPDRQSNHFVVFFINFYRSYGFFVHGFDRPIYFTINAEF